MVELDDERRSPPHRDWWRDLLAAQKQVRDRMDMIARILSDLGHDLAPQQAAILPYLADRRERAAGWFLKNAYIGTNNTYNLRVLADKEYLVCRAGTGDRRQRLYRLTDKGAKLAKVLKAVMAKTHKGGE